MISPSALAINVIRLYFLIKSNNTVQYLLILNTFITTIWQSQIVDKQLQTSKDNSMFKNRLLVVTLFTGQQNKQLRKLLAQIQSRWLYINNHKDKVLIYCQNVWQIVICIRHLSDNKEFVYQNTNTSIFYWPINMNFEH